MTKTLESPPAPDKIEACVDALMLESAIRNEESKSKPDPKVLHRLQGLRLKSYGSSVQELEEIRSGLSDEDRMKWELAIESCRTPPQLAITCAELRANRKSKVTYVPQIPTVPLTPGKDSLVRKPIELPPAFIPRKPPDGSISENDVETTSWSGRVSSETAAEFERSRGVVRSAAHFKQLWALAFPSKKVPRIDFDNNVVLTAVAQSSGVALRFERKKAELVTNVTVTADLTSDYGVVLVVAPTAGIRKVDGRPL